MLTHSSQSPHHQPFLEQIMVALRERFAPLNRHYEEPGLIALCTCVAGTGIRRSSMQSNVRRPNEFRVGTFFASSSIRPASLLTQKTSRLEPSGSALTDISYFRTNTWAASPALWQTHVLCSAAMRFSACCSTNVSWPNGNGAQNSMRWHSESRQRSLLRELNLIQKRLLRD